MYTTWYPVGLRLPLFFLCAVFTVNFATAQDHERITLSNRIGDVIAPDEQAYFGLFYDVHAFREATAHRTGDTTFAFKVRYGREPARDTTLLVGSRQLSALQDYLERYEALLLEEATIDWAPLKGLARPAPVIARRRMVHVSTVEDQMVTGWLAFADTSRLFLFTPSPDPGGEPLANRVRVLPYEFIRHVRIEGQGSSTTPRTAVRTSIGLQVLGTAATLLIPKDYVALPVLIGAGAWFLAEERNLRERLVQRIEIDGRGTDPSQVREALEPYVMFWRQAPPEFARPALFAPPGGSIGSHPSRPTKNQGARLHVLIGPSYRLPVGRSYERTLAHNIRFAPGLEYDLAHDRPAARMSIIGLRAEVAWSIQDRLEVGLDANLRPRPLSSLNEEAVSGLSTAAYLSYTLRSAGRYGTGPYALSVGAGPVFNWVTTSARFELPLPSTLQRQGGNQTVKNSETAVGLHWRAMVERFISPQISLAWKLSGNVGAGVATAPSQYLIQWGGKTHVLGEARRESVDLSLLELALGFRWHL